MAITREWMAQALIELAEALKAAEIPFAVAGAHAVALHGHPRATRDIDVLTRAEFRDAANATMRRLGYSRVAASAGFAQYERTPAPGPGGLVERADLLFSSRPLGARALEQAALQPIAWHGVSLPVVPVAALILMKLMAHGDDPRRPYDLGDARKLLESHRALIDVGSLQRDADEIGADVRALVDRLLDETGAGVREERFGHGAPQLRL